MAERGSVRDNQPNENPTGLGAFNYNLRFPGQYYDAEKASNYNYFRDYDPVIGRYVESDPIGLQAGVNTFAYVRGRSLKLADPYGLKAQVCCRHIPGLPAAHCFINELHDNGCPESTDRRIGLQGPPPFGSSSHKNDGEIHTNDPFDDPDKSSCGTWNEDPTTHRCIDNNVRTYADPSRYRLLGPNSNTFASTISHACGLGVDSPGYWPTPGWGQPPAGPGGGK